MGFLRNLRFLLIFGLVADASAHVINRRDAEESGNREILADDLRTPQKFIIEPVQTITKNADNLIVPPPYDEVDFGTDDKFNEIAREEDNDSTNSGFILQAKKTVTEGNSKDKPLTTLASGNAVENSKLSADEISTAAVAEGVSKDQPLTILAAGNTVVPGYETSTSASKQSSATNILDSEPVSGDEEILETAETDSSSLAKLAINVSIANKTVPEGDSKDELLTTLASESTVTNPKSPVEELSASKQSSATIILDSEPVSTDEERLQTSETASSSSAKVPISVSQPLKENEKPTPKNDETSGDIVKQEIVGEPENLETSDDIVKPLTKNILDFNQNSADVADIETGTEKILADIANVPNVKETESANSDKNDPKTASNKETSLKLVPETSDKSDSSIARETLPDSNLETNNENDSKPAESEASTPDSSDSSEGVKNKNDSKPTTDEVPSIDSAKTSSTSDIDAKLEPNDPPSSVANKGEEPEETGSTQVVNVAKENVLPIEFPKSEKPSEDIKKTPSDNVDVDRRVNTDNGLESVTDLEKIVGRNVIETESGDDSNSIISLEKDIQITTIPKVETSVTDSTEKSSNGVDDGNEAKSADKIETSIGLTKSLVDSKTSAEEEIPSNTNTHVNKEVIASESTLDHEQLSEDLAKFTLAADEAETKASELAATESSKDKSSPQVSASKEHVVEESNIDEVNKIVAVKAEETQPQNLKEALKTSETGELNSAAVSSELTDDTTSLPTKIIEEAKPDFATRTLIEESAGDNSVVQEETEETNTSNTFPQTTVKVDSNSLIRLEEAVQEISNPIPIVLAETEKISSNSSSKNTESDTKTESFTRTLVDGVQESSTELSAADADEPASDIAELPSSKDTTPADILILEEAMKENVQPISETEKKLLDITSTVESKTPQPDTASQPDTTSSPQEDAKHEDSSKPAEEIKISNVQVSSDSSVTSTPPHEIEADSAISTEIPLEKNNGQLKNTVEDTVVISKESSEAPNSDTNSQNEKEDVDEGENIVSKPVNNDIVPGEETEDIINASTENPPASEDFVKPITTPNESEASNIEITPIDEQSLIIDNTETQNDKVHKESGLLAITESQQNNDDIQIQVPLSSEDRIEMKPIEISANKAVEISAVKISTENKLPGSYEVKTESINEEHVGSKPEGEASEIKPISNSPNEVLSSDNQSNIPNEGNNTLATETTSLSPTNSDKTESIPDKIITETEVISSLIASSQQSEKLLTVVTNASISETSASNKPSISVSKPVTSKPMRNPTKPNNPNVNKVSSSQAATLKPPSQLPSKPNKTPTSVNKPSSLTTNAQIQKPAKPSSVSADKPVRVVHKPVTSSSPEKPVRVVYIKTTTAPKVKPNNRNTPAPNTPPTKRANRKPTSAPIRGTVTQTQNKIKPSKPVSPAPTVPTQKPAQNSWFINFPSLSGQGVAFPAFFGNHFNNTNTPAIPAPVVTNKNQSQSTFGVGFLAVPWNWKPLNFTSLNFFSPQRVIETTPPKEDVQKQEQLARDLAFWNSLFHRSYNVTKQTTTTKSPTTKNPNQTTSSGFFKPFGNIHYKAVSIPEFFKILKSDDSTVIEDNVATIPANTQILHLYLPLKFPFQGKFVQTRGIQGEPSAPKAKPQAPQTSSVSNKVEFYEPRSSLKAESVDSAKNSSAKNVESEKTLETVIVDSVKATVTDEKASVLLELEMPQPIVQLVNSIATEQPAKK